MGDALVKMVGVVILAIALIVYPVVIATVSDESTVKRYTLNSVQNFLDIVTDKGEITKRDYENFVVDLHASGIVYDVEVIFEQRLVYQSEIQYVAKDVLTSSSGWPDTLTDVDMRQGDKVIVRVKSVGRTQGERLAYSMLGLYLPNVEVNMSRVNRN